MEERMPRVPGDGGVRGPTIVETIGVGPLAAIIGMLSAGIAVGYLMMMRRRRPTFTERLRERLGISLPEVALPALAATTEQGIERGRWFARWMGRQARPGFEMAGERARELAENAQRTTEELNRSFQRDLMPRARRVQREYGLRAQEALERSIAVGSELTSRLQHEVLPRISRQARELSRFSAPQLTVPMEGARTAAMSTAGWVAGLPLRLAGGLLGVVVRLMLGLVGFVLFVGALVGVVIFIYAPESRQRQQLFQQIGGLATGVGDFVNDIRQAFVEPQQPGV